MTVTRLVASGNWSNAAIFQNGVKPLPGTTVAANGFTAIIDEDIAIGGRHCPLASAGSFVVGAWYFIENIGTTSWTAIGALANTAGVVFQATGAGSGSGQARAIGTLTTAAVAGSSAGGGFQVTSGTRTIAADIRAGTAPCLSLSGNASVILDGTGLLAGNLIRCRFAGGPTSGAHGIVNGSTGSVTFNECSGFFNTSFTHGLLNNGGGAVVVNSGFYATAMAANSRIFEITNGTFSAESAIFNNSLSTANAAGCVAGGVSSAITVNNSTITGAGAGGAAFQISGSLSGSGNMFIGGYAALFTGTGTSNLTGNTYAAAANGPAIVASSQAIEYIVGGNEIDHSSTGIVAVSVWRRRHGSSSPPVAATRQGFLANNASYIQAGADYPGFGMPAPGDVRSGTAYASGQLIGTLEATSPAISAIRADLERPGGMLDLKLNASEYVEPPSSAAIAAETWSIADRAITGGTVDTLLNAPIVPSAIEIASAVNSSLDRTGFALINEERAAIGAAVWAYPEKVVTEIASLDLTGFVNDVVISIERADGKISAIENAMGSINVERLENVVTTEILAASLVAAIGP